MKAEQVDQALIQKFVTEGARLVFWHDPHAEFADHVAAGLSSELESVTVLDLRRTGGFAAKLLLEREDPTGKYLVYSSGDAARPEADWLLDIRLYSDEFHADIASIWMQELGLTRLHLRDHIKARAPFFASQDRRRRLGRFIAPDANEEALDRAMMAVLAGGQDSSSFSILRAVLHGHAQEDSYDLSREPEFLATLEKMGLGSAFWKLVEDEFAYVGDSPSLGGLVRRLFVSELLQDLPRHRIDSLAHFRLPATGSRNAKVFLTQWRDSSGQAHSYDLASLAVANELDITAAVREIPLTDLRDIDTFWVIERRIVSELKRQVMDTEKLVDLEEVRQIASDRRAGHWLAGPGCDEPDRRALGSAYDAIVAAAELFRLKAERLHDLRFESPGALLAAYRDDLFRVDQLYRRFCTQAQLAERRGWDLLKELSGQVEATYDTSFLQPLGLEWSRILDDGFLDTWSLEGTPAQYEFYAHYIEPHLADADRRRAYVIISDAFRYEAADELVDSLNSRFRMDAKLESMLGVLPSYTALGMASLLPHETLAYNDKGEVLLDGNPVAGTEARDRQLGKVQGMACQAAELRVMKTDDAREYTRDKKVVYIYHNVIDARGDSASTEGEAFAAVSDCIRELGDLVHFCINKMNAAKVWVTADHGFLFQQTSPGLTDRTSLTDKPTQAVKVKKRYVIGKNLGDSRGAHHGSTQATACAEGGMEFWIPRGANRFHFTGGARFVHGGAMPQEVVIPVVTVTQLRGAKAEVSRVRKVGVQLLGASHKITTPKYRFEFIQTEAVGDRREPLTVRVAVYEGEQAVTSVDTVTFESASDSLEERKKSVRLELRAGTFDKAKPYRLVLRDVDTDAEVLAVPVTIDRSFDDDF